MNESIAKRTQDSLGKIIGKKPPLTEKLLNRPPFRFLHDIITSVIRQTGFMKGLFTEKESSAESITTKEEKVAFLQKAIDITVYVTGTKLSVRPSKVVAGLEAEKTNDFLQALAAAIEKKPDNEACVKKILGGGSGEPSSRSRDSNAKESGDSKDKDRERSADRRKRRSDRNEKSSSKPSSSKKDKENRQSSDRREGSGRNKEREERKDRERDRDERKDRDREERKERDRDERKERDRDERKEKEREDRRHRDSSKDGRRESSRHRESSRDRKETDRRDDRRERSSKGHRKREEEQVNGHTDETNAESAPAADDAEGEDEPTSNRIPRPSSAKGSRRRHREETKIIFPLRHESMQSGKRSSRRGRRRAKGRRPQPDMEDDDNAQSERKSMQQSGGQEEDSVVPPQVEQTRRLARPSSARPAPPRVKRQDGGQDSLTERVDSARTQRVQNVIIDNAQHSEEEEDDSFMVEEGAQDPLVPEREETIAPPTEDDGQHGGLVKKILESKKEYAQSEQPQQSQTKTKIDKSSMNDAARHKEKEMVKKEVDKLRGSIQTLTRSANPLGKIMDYVQEDLHSMQKERDMWKAENRKLTEQIKQELSVTDGSIEPLKVTLAQLEQAVADQLDLIAAVKHSIIDNDEKITKMISSVSRT